MLILREPEGLRDSVVTCADHELIGSRRRSKQIDRGGVATLLPDDDIIIVRVSHCAPSYLSG